MTEPVNIFVIDDSEDDRLLYRRSLMKNANTNYNISEATNGEEGMRYLQAEHPSCVLLDYSMPGQSGVEILKSIRSKYPFIAVVMLTGQGDTMVAVNAMKAGAQDYLPKDAITAEILQKSVHNAIEKVELLKQLHSQNEELKEANIRLQSATKAKNEFLANMSHELRTPMNSVLGMTELLLTTELNQKQERYANAIYNSGNMMLDLISDILDFSKIEIGELKLNSVPTILRDIAEEVVQIQEKTAIEKNIKLTINYDSNIPNCVIVDPVRLRQIILNLTSNAIKFTSNGSVTVSVKQIEANGSQTTLNFSVEDTGIGIAKDKQEFIFEKFTQVDSSSTRKYGGTGLGLSICKTLVELMRGRIGVVSELGKGSTFWFEVELPIAELMVH